MTAALGWYAAVQVLGAAAHLLAGPYLRRLPDAGYGVSKTLGVLLLGVGLWLGTALGLLRNDPAGAFLVAGGLVVAAAVAAPCRRLPRRRVIVASEVTFAVAFVGWCLLRSLTPAANHTEQPMDLMLLTAMSANPTLPPVDPWLSGYPIGYYYLGYWLMNAVGFLSRQPPQVSYTLGQACWFALLVLGGFSLGFNLSAASGFGRRRLRPAVAAGVTTALVLALSGNLYLPLSWVSGTPAASGAATASGGWWWWQSSRVLQDVSPAGRPIELITEFPFFSYVLGDDHPHLLSMPFVVLAASLAFAVFLERRAPQAATARFRARGGRGVTARRGGLVLAMVVTGALVALNTWDLPAALGLLMVAGAWPMGERQVWRGTIRRAIAVGIAAVGVTLVVYFPYLVTAQSQVRGVLPNLWHPTSAGQFLTMFGTLLPGVAVLVWLAWREERPARGDVVPVVVGLLLGAAAWLSVAALWTVYQSDGRAWMASMAPGVEHPLRDALARWAVGWPVATMACLSLGATAALVRARMSRTRHGADGLTFGLVLAVTGLGLVTLPEFVYVRDLFGTRMNTVFKFYYQAWVYLGAAGALGIAIAWRRGGRDRAVAVAALGIAACGLVYPAATLRSVIQAGTAEAPTLDALAFLRRQAPDEWAGIAWVRQHTPPGAVIAQAPGDSYRVDQSLVSTATGRPTLLGWQGHERQWRGDAYAAMAAGRLEGLQRIYRPASADALREALDTWHVSFVWVGRLERRRYAMTADDEALLSRVMDLAFEHGAVRVYRRRG